MREVNREIIPRYEVVFDDLKNHSIGYYLTSREFKNMMIKNDYYDEWSNLYEQVKRTRRVFIAGANHQLNDNVTTLGIVLNLCNDNTDAEEVVTLIITSFIAFKKTSEDFSDVIDAMKIAEFTEESINQVIKSFEKHKGLNLPPKEKAEPAVKKYKTKKNKKDIFIVHGHNEEIKEKVARTIDKLKLNPIILNEKSNEGLTIIEKFEKYSDVDFAVILLTYDDYGNIKSNKEENKRARQNVILELGYFIAKIGRKNVMPLYEKGVELPSDFSGVLYTLIDDAEHWKFDLAKELKSAGFNIDVNNIL